MKMRTGQFRLGDPQPRQSTLRSVRTATSPPETGVAVSEATDQPGLTAKQGGSVPPEVDVSKASVAWEYDYVLGKDSSAIDRKAANAFIEKVSGSALIARDNRSFLRRGVRYLAGAVGTRQFMDTGSGLPAAGNVQEIAHKVGPVVLASRRALLVDNHTMTAVKTGSREPDSIIDDREPVAVLVSGLPFERAVAAPVRFWPASILAMRCCPTPPTLN